MEKKQIHFQAMLRRWAAKNGVMSNRWKTREEVMDVAQASGLSGSRAPCSDGAWEKEGLVCLENYKDAD